MYSLRSVQKGLEELKPNQKSCRKHYSPLKNCRKDWNLEIFGIFETLLSEELMYTGNTSEAAYNQRGKTSRQYIVVHGKHLRRYIVGRWKTSTQISIYTIFGTKNSNLKQLELLPFLSDKLKPLQKSSAAIAILYFLAFYG